MSTVDQIIEPKANGIIGRVNVAIWNLQRALLVTRREVVDMFRDWRILSPIIILTVIFPAIANWGAGRMFGYLNEFGANLIGERLIPFLMMVVGFFPSSFSLIIALESFVGEKERRSLEPLLSTPLTDTQLYIGKMLSSTMPPVLGSIIGITVYLIGVYTNIQWEAPPVLVVQIILLTFLQALVMVAGAVVVSSQSTSVRAANLLASFIIIPVAFLIQLEAFVMFLASYDLIWWILLGLLVILILLIRMGIHSFNREEMLGRELDDINLRLFVREWWSNMLAKCDGALPRPWWRWYQEEVLGLIGKLRYEILAIVAAIGAALFIGAQYAQIFVIPRKLLHTEEFNQRFNSALSALGFAGAPGILFVIIQNVRVLFAASLLGTFSFGVGMIIILMVPFALASYFMIQLNNAGIDTVAVLATIVPHTILEAPAAVLAGAVALRLGAVVISPPPSKTVGQAWTQALSEATRLWIWLILPLLIVAAVVEVAVTPVVVTWLVGTH